VDERASPVEPTAEEIAAGERLFAQRWQFVKGVVDLDALPAPDRPEVAFAGRSNVGKSSLINALVRQNNLARTSNTPGRTQELNFFWPDDHALYLADMPGYGFAKAPKSKVEAWTALVMAYLAGRPSLRRAFLLIDSRHGIKPADREIMSMLDSAAVLFQIVLTKADKVSASELAARVKAIAASLAHHPAAFPHVLATSAAKGQGLPELRAAVANILEDHPPIR